jgi:Cyclic nucleotide-binding domain/Major Facilitator Superfamily
MRSLLSHIGPPVHALRAVLRNRPMTRMQMAFLLFNVAEPAMWIGVLLFAFDLGGTAAVGFVTLLCCVPSGILAPVAAALGDRFPRDRVVRRGYLAQSVATALLAASIATDSPSWAVYALALLATIPFTTGRPNHHAIVPTLAVTPEEVAASNSVSALAEGIGYVIGGLGAALLATIGPGAIVAEAAVACFCAVLLTLGVHAPSSELHDEVFHPWSLATDAIGGLLTLIRSRGPRLLVVISGALAIGTGAVGVLMVPLAIDRLGLGDPGVGLLGTMQSVGLFVGAGASVGFATRRKLTVGVVVAAAAFWLGTAGLGAAVGVASAMFAAIAYGAGITLLDVVGRTMLQRATSDDVLTRVFGAVEGLWLLGYAAGAVVAPAAQDVIGLGVAFAILGGVVFVAVLIALPAMRRMDASAVVPERQLALVTNVPFFAPLPRFDKERIARQLDLLQVPAGAEVIRQGDVGDRFYIAEDGTFEVEVDRRRVGVVDPGGFFGEIALLHDVPRTATIRALTDAAVWALDQEEFLATVTGLPQAQSAAHALSAERLRAQPRG